MQPTMTLLGSAAATLVWTRHRLASHRFLQNLIIPMAALFETLATCRLPVPVPIPVPTRRPHFQAVALAALLGTLAIAPQPAVADHERWLPDDGYPNRGVDFTADGQLVDVQVLVEGRTAPLYFAPGRFDRHYFQAFRGRHYSLALRNNSSRRIGVLIAVDGLNVVNGSRSSLSRNEAMYVLDPWENATIKGWRTSTREVRRFVFVDEERSYAERTGQANGDLGWIRVLAFAERGQGFRPYDEPQVRDDQPGRGDPRTFKGEPAPQDTRQRSPEAAPRSQMGFESERENSNPGTGWGERSWDPVRRTWFEAESHATDHLVLRYEYASGLRALGIRPGWDRDRLRDRERGELGFSQPPRW